MIILPGKPSYVLPRAVDNSFCCPWRLGTESKLPVDLETVPMWLAVISHSASSDL